MFSLRWVGPKSNIWCPSERRGPSERKGHERWRQRLSNVSIGQGHQGHWQPPEARKRPRTDCTPGASRRNQLGPHLDSGHLASRAEQEQTSAISSHLNCGTLLQQPQQTRTHLYPSAHTLKDSRSPRECHTVTEPSTLYGEWRGGAW